ncbi:hypothetical protein B0J18DRAFT_440766 [Chaetomium sp. MPI-SDFR-AT-0129]|nr:hypothetical protein B0J18DRAFT_440766 [Chaetomium sp. MPI-SDFR-AT-0129]
MYRKLSGGHGKLQVQFGPGSTGELHFHTNVTAIDPTTGDATEHRVYSHRSINTNRPRSPRNSRSRSRPRSRSRSRSHRGRSSSHNPRDKYSLPPKTKDISAWITEAQHQPMPPKREWAIPPEGLTTKFIEPLTAYTAENRNRPRRRYTPSPHPYGEGNERGRRRYREDFGFSTDSSSDSDSRGYSPSPSRGRSEPRRSHHQLPDSSRADDSYGAKYYYKTTQRARHHDGDAEYARAAAGGQTKYESRNKEYADSARYASTTAYPHGDSAYYRYESSRTAADPISDGVRYYTVKDHTGGRTSQYGVNIPQPSTEARRSSRSGWDGDYGSGRDGARYYYYEEVRGPRHGGRSAADDGGYEADEQYYAKARAIRKEQEKRWRKMKKEQRLLEYERDVSPD